MSKIDSESISKDTITTIDDNTDDLETGHTSIESKIDTIDTNVDSVQTDTTAIKASTDTLLTRRENENMRITTNL